MYVVCPIESAQAHDSDDNLRASLALVKGPVWLRCYLRWSVHIPLRIAAFLTLATSSNGLTTSRHFWLTGKLPIRHCMSLPSKIYPPDTRLPTLQEVLRRSRRVQAARRGMGSAFLPKLPDTDATYSGYERCHSCSRARTSPHRCLRQRTRC